jgi:hypothetical protein
MQEDCLGGNGDWTRPRVELRNPTETISRLILTEGIFTVLLGIFVIFFLPDCKNFTREYLIQLSDKLSSSFECILAFREREGLYPS